MRSAEIASSCARMGQAAIRSIPIDLSMIAVISYNLKGPALGPTNHCDDRATPYASTSIGSREHSHHTGSGRRIPASGDALLHWQRLLRDGAAGSEGLLSRAYSVPAAACRHHLQVP